MPFRSGNLPVFDRSGFRLGSLNTWSVTGPRTYRLNEVEDFSFFVPRNDGPTSIITEPELPPLIGYDGAATASGTSVTLSRPSGTLPGDKLLAVIAYRDRDNIPQPPMSLGWVHEGGVHGPNDVNLRIYSWVVSAANPSTYVIAQSGGAAQAIAAGVVAYRRGYRFRPIVTRANERDQIRIPPISTPIRNEWVLGVAVADRNVIWTPPEDWAGLFNQHVTGISLRGAHISVLRDGLLEADRQFTTTSAGVNISLGCVVQETPSVEAMLTRDNLIYVANSINMPAWGGVIDVVEYTDLGADVRALGTASLLRGIETTRIEADEGLVWPIARRLVMAATAKQAGAGDLRVNFVIEGSITGSKRNRGFFAYEGDILEGLQDLANNTLSEFKMSSAIGTDGRFQTNLHWSDGFKADHTDVIIRDGVGGQLTPGTKVSFTGSQKVTFARLRGASTQMAQEVDYPAVGEVIREIVPEATFAEPAAPGSVGSRHRERVDLSVSWGLPKAKQKELALVTQQRYIDLYKRFLYAYHDRWGAPFLPGYDWGGPTEGNAKQMRMHDMRTVNVFGRLGDRTITFHPNDLANHASIYDFREKERLEISQVVGVAVDYARPRYRWVARGDTDNIQAMYNRDLQDEVLNVTPAGGNLMGVSTDPAEPGQVWTLAVTGVDSTVTRWDVRTGANMGAWTIPDVMTDLAVDVPRGIVYLTPQALQSGNGGRILIRDLANGASTGNVEMPSQPGLPGIVAAGLGQINGQFVYWMGTNGTLWIRYAADNTLAGTRTLPYNNVNGLFIDPVNREMWLCFLDHIQVFYATLAVAETGIAGPVNGAPGFAEISVGQFVHIVMARDRSQVGYNVPPRPPPPEDPGDPGDPDPEPKPPPEEFEPSMRNLWAPAGTKYGWPYGQKRRSPLASIRNSIPILAVLHSTNSDLYAGQTPGIQTGQGTSNEVNAHFAQDIPLFSYYIARDGGLMFVVQHVDYASPTITSIRAPNRNLPTVKYVMDKFIDRVKDIDDDGHIVWYDIKNCNYNAGRREWQCTYRPHEFVLNSIAFTASSNHGINAKQIKTAAWIIASDSFAYGGWDLSRTRTVLAHSDFDSLYRNCPIDGGGSGTNNFVARVVREAKAWKKKMKQWDDNNEDNAVSDDDRDDDDVPDEDVPGEHPGGGGQ